MMHNSALLGDSNAKISRASFGLWNTAETLAERG